jgi:hypothetical protein
MPVSCLPLNDDDGIPINTTASSKAINIVVRARVIPPSLIDFTFLPPSFFRQQQDK